MKHLGKIALFAAALTMLGCANQSSDLDSNDPAATGKADSVGSDWRARIEKDVKALQDSDPHLYRTLKDLQGKPTRPGFLRMRGSDLHTPAAASMFLTRYLSEREAASRIALVEALPRTGGQYEDAIVELMDSERDASVRAMMVGILSRSTSAKAMQGIVKGLGDSAANVRLEAAVSAGRHEGGAAAAPALEARLADSDAGVRAAAARSLGVHQVASATDALAARLADDSADVRLQALRALSRIDATATAARADVARLASDPDARVRSLAGSVTRANY